MARAAPTLTVLSVDDPRVIEGGVSLTVRIHVEAGAGSDEGIVKLLLPVEVAEDLGARLQVFARQTRLRE